MAATNERGDSSPPQARIGAFDAGYERCVRFYGQHRLADAARAADDLTSHWLTVPDLPVKARDQLGNAMWISCNCPENDSAGNGRSAPAHGDLRGLDDLIAWLREQPEPLFRRREARMLCERMRWHRGHDRELDSFEELAELLTDLDDLDVTKVMAMTLVRALPALVLIPSSDEQRYEGGLVRRLDDDEADLPDPDALGVADSTVDRMERLADAMSQLEDCLDRDGDPAASELRAAILLAEAEVVARLGQQARFEALYDRILMLGAAALRACDSLIERDAEAEQAGDQRAAVSIAGSLMVKAGLLTLAEDEDAALVVFTEVIDRFGAREDPVIAAMVRTARELQREMIEEDED
jgi:hypothetical protein